MSELKIEDLRLLCEHGQMATHIVDPFSSDSWTCPGGRVPTRKQLIDILDIDYEAATDYVLTATEQSFYSGGVKLSIYQADQLIRHVMVAALGEDT